MLLCLSIVVYGHVESTQLWEQDEVCKWFINWLINWLVDSVVLLINDYFADSGGWHGVEKRWQCLAMRVSNCWGIFDGYLLDE